MKAFVTSFIFAFFMVTSIYGSNNSAIPEKALKALRQAFPQAEEIIWLKKTGGTLEARLLQHNLYYNIRFSASGQMLESYLKISREDLPAQVISYLEKNYPGVGISRISENICCFEKRAYQVEVYRNHKWYQLTFNKSGQLVRCVIKPFLDHWYL